MCIIGINIKSEVTILALINSNGDLIATNILVNGFFMPMVLPNYLCMAISFKSMTIKIVVNEFEHFTAIDFS